MGATQAPELVASPGLYLTNGSRLFFVVRVEDRVALLEDCAWPGRPPEVWGVVAVVEQMRLVRPHGAG